MTDDLLTHIAAVLLGALIGGAMAAMITGGILSMPEKHHQEAYDAHGNLTCEFCKELIKKGNTNGK